MSWFQHYSTIDVFRTCMLVFVMSNASYAAKPVPDTKGREFVFTTPLCVPEFPAKMYIVPQTTEAVNVTLLAGNEHTFYEIPENDVFRREIPCSFFSWGIITNDVVFVNTDQEVHLYIEYADDNYLVHPTDTHGTTFTVLTPYSYFLLQSFLVINGNSSAIEIVLPADLVSSVQYDNEQYSAGSKLNLRLQANESLGIKCFCDLTGVRIHSDQPISVVVGAMSGTRKGVIEQLPPENIWGRRFIFADHPSFAKNVTLKVTGLSANSYLSVSVKDSTMTSQIDTPTTQSMQLLLSDLVAVESNSSMLCFIRYDIYDLSNQSRLAFKFLAPLLLYHVYSTFTSDLPTDVSISANFVLTVHTYPHVLFNTSSIEHPFERPMIYFWRYYICKAVTLKPPYSVRTNAKNVVPYYASVIRRENNTAYEYSLGMRITNIYDACVKITAANGGNGDGIDNDCDNAIDEEYRNHRDDDNDGVIDEDIHYVGNIPPKHIDAAWEYYRKNRESEEGFSISVVAVVVSISVAISAAGAFFGIMLLVEKVRTMLDGTRVGALN